MLEGCHISLQSSILFDSRTVFITELTVTDMGTQGEDMEPTLLLSLLLGCWETAGQNKGGGITSCPPQLSKGPMPYHIPLGNRRLA